MASKRWAALSTTAARVVALVVVLGVAAGALYFFVFAGSGQRTITARFTSAVGLYPGTPVKILGVEVGKVDTVTPEGGFVRVTMTYSDAYPLPADAKALLVANSLVSDRFVQLAPAYTGGARLADRATIPLTRTAAPAELDDIYAALDKLSVALGPRGANRPGGAGKDGPLSTLVDVAAANLKGNGAAIGRSITTLSQAAQTLADGRGDLFATVAHLRTFTKALSDSDAQVRLFNRQLAQVSGQLAAERGDLGAALQQLGLALDEVAQFVHANAGRLHRSLGGLASVTGVLVRERDSLQETLAVAPVALANIVHAYQPNLGAIGTRSNIESLTDPGQICELLTQAGQLPTGRLTKPILGTTLGQLADTCRQVIKKLPADQIAKISSQIIGLLGGTGGSGGLGGLVGAGSTPGDTDPTSSASSNDGLGGLLGSGG